MTNSIPAWFNAGVAVIVSDDGRYLAPTDAPDRCFVRQVGQATSKHNVRMESDCGRPGQSYLC
jgi:hypothetical protein